jgi:hypothetical protein
MQKVVDSKRKAKSVDKSAAIPSDKSAIENQHFDELFKITMKQISDVNQQYKQQKLLEKIKENGSLYAVPSTNENNQVTEMRDIIENMGSVIAKPEKLFKDKEISSLYKKFKVQIDKVREQEEAEQLEKDKKKKANNQTPHKKIDMLDSDYEDVLSEQFDDYANS